MKIFKRLALISLALTIAVAFCSCASNKIEVNLNQNSDTYIENEDCQNYISEASTFVKSGDTYYFIENSILYCYDTKSREMYPVCNQINCEHSDSNCAAYLSAMEFYPGMNMFYYDNALYVLGFESDGLSRRQVYMYQISLENFKRKKAAYLFDGTGGLSLSCKMHRGYIYFANCFGGTEKTTAVLYRVKLGETDENSAEKIFEFKGIGATIAGLSAYGNNLYFNTTSFSDAQGNGYKSILNYINIHTLESCQIPEAKYSHFADQGRLYYCKDESKIFYYDLKAREHKEFCDIAGPCFISADSNYIYFDNSQSVIVGKTDESDRKIFVYDKSGNYITEIVPKNPKDECYFGGDDIMIFKEKAVGETITDSSDTNSAKGYYVLDKSQLTSPDKQFIDI